MEWKKKYRSFNCTLVFKLWPAEHKCIANQFNPVIVLQPCSFTWCVVDSSARPTPDPAWPATQAGAKAPTSEAHWPGRGTPLKAFWHQVQTQKKPIFQSTHAATIMILSSFKWGFIAFVFGFVFGDICLMDWVSAVSSGSPADKNVRTGFLVFSDTHRGCLTAA